MLTFQGYGGVTLAADAYGVPDDPAVVLLPGGGQTRRSWREAARALAAAGRYVVALDLRGHGDSGWAQDGRYDLDAYVGDLHAVLTQLQTRPVIVGASIGGLVAMAAMGDGGDALASGLVLVDAAPWIDVEASQKLADVLLQQSKGFANLAEAAQAAHQLAPGRGIQDPEALKTHLRQDSDGRYYWRWDPRFLSGFDLSALERLEAIAPRLTLPTLVVHGAESPIVTADEIARFRELLPSAEFVDVEGAGHLIAAEKTDAFNAVLLEFLERRVPRAPLAFESGSAARTLRDALGCFATGVVIGTTLNEKSEPVGLTANSFTSVSLDPPLVLFCIAKTAGSLAAFEASKTFAINVLHIGQQPASALFASRNADRFGSVEWEQWETGAPIIKGSLVSIECDRYSVTDGGDHVVFIGKVRRASYEPRRDPLLYFRGKYRRIHFL